MTQARSGYAALCFLVATLAVVGPPVASAADPPIAVPVERGQYLAIAGDCVACHTAPGGKPFAGGLAIATPIGPIISTNITPSRTHGIGNYSLEQFANAVRKGVRGDGAQLYPAMPYTSYAQVTDDDVRALYAYFMHGVQAVDSAASQTALPFPFDIRMSMIVWNFLFLTDKPFEVHPEHNAQWNRGAYLVRGLAHCGACHTPRNLMMAEKVSRDLAGSSLGTWYAPNITSDGNSGIGAWSEQDLVNYLSAGHAVDKAQAAGPMAEAIDNSLRHVTKDDLLSIVTYLKSVPAIHDDADTRPAFQWGAAGNDLATVRGVAWPADRDDMSGPQLYDAYCATCHQADGQGRDEGRLPSLFHNTTLGRTNTDNLVMVILNGVRRQSDTGNMLMPGFRSDLSDRQVATLGSYLMRRYGVPAIVVTAPQVSTLRGGGSDMSWFIVAARAGMAVAIGFVALIVVFVSLRWRRRGVST